MSVFPTTTSEITAEWMTEALRGSGTIGPDVTVADVLLDPASAGVGFMGEVAKVGLVYAGDSPGAPTTVIAKFPTQSPDIRAMMHPTRIYEREHRFYAEVAAQSPARTPAVYHVTCEPAATPADERYILLMEDLADFVLGDQVAGVPPAQARAALVGLAAHHARFWNGAGLEDADFIPVINGPLNQAGSAIYDASLPGFMAAFADSIKPELAAFVAGYSAARPQVLDDLAAMPHTLVHFDFRADNLFFADDGTVVIIDWQAISQGGGAADVGYFVSQNMSTEDRRAHESDLLHTYHDTLVANGVTDYDYDTLVEDYKVGINCGWMIPVLAVGSLDFTSERAIALWTAVIERAQNALLDHGFGQ
ncbi:MAG: oxidoreductase family protein [Ilumatobacteraceae bacterium]